MYNKTSFIYHNHRRCSQYAFTDNPNEYCCITLYYNLGGNVPQTSSYTDRIHFVTKSGRTNITLAIIIYKSKTSSIGLCGILWHENKAQKDGKRRTGRNNETKLKKIRHQYSLEVHETWDRHGTHSLRRSDGEGLQPCEKREYTPIIIYQTIYYFNSQYWDHNNM